MVSLPRRQGARVGGSRKGQAQAEEQTGAHDATEEPPVTDEDVRRILARIEPGDYDRARALCELSRDVNLRAALTLILEEREPK